jgi:bacteriocin biosynthesis cyclodehydratase domain-containing protein
MNRIVIFAEGAFGRDVAARLAAVESEVRTYPLAESSTEFAALVNGADFVCAALWRRYVRECDLLDEACFERGIAWSSAVLEGSGLLSGPLIVPGSGGCYACYRKRWMTHAARPDREAALDQAYELDPALGSHGYPPSAAAMAAAGLLLDRRDRETGAGRIRHVNLLTGDAGETRVVRVHGCKRCSPSGGNERFVRHLVPAVEEMLR